MAGPAMSPSPKAAPIRPSPRALSSFDVLSAMYAWAVASVPLAAPARTTARTREASVWARPSSR
jgi:hypothetical protein